MGPLLGCGPQMEMNLVSHRHLPLDRFGRQSVLQEPYGKIKTTGGCSKLRRMKGAGRPAGSETMGSQGSRGAELTSEQPRSASVPCAAGSKLQSEGFTSSSLDPTQITYGANPTGCSFPHLSAPVWPFSIRNFTGLLGLCFRRIDTWMR